MTTDFHARWHASQLRLLRAHDGSDVGGLSRSVGDARVDLNPHQIDAALFALKSPVARGVMLADEVGLGKTIEAGLCIAQRWAERRRKVLLIVPATLRPQWQRELLEKFSVPSVVLDSRAANDLKRKGAANPFTQGERVVIASYQFIAARADDVQAVPWDLVVIDEAHRLRNVWNKKATSARRVVDAVRAVGRKVLLTATPLQNSLMELYGLVSILDDKVFLDEKTFRERFVSATDPLRRDDELRARLRPLVRRTLRSQVQEYVRYTERWPLTVKFFPSPQEQDLYDAVSTYLQRDRLAALPDGQRKLITMVLRKLLASSSAAIGATLGRMAKRLEAGQRVDTEDLSAEYTPLDDTLEELDDATDAGGQNTADTAALAAAERAELEHFAELARSIPRDAKAQALLDALEQAFAKAAEKGAARKAVIFTESVRTQESLFALLSAHGYAGQIALMNGSNNDPTSQAIYQRWRERHKGRSDLVTGSRAVDIKSAIVEAFRDEATLLIATESAAEGVNLQFCSLVINYDLPWNPQRIEQRIGRCHRYGQKHDVVVVNFLNEANQADQRVHQLLAEKFQLFSGVFGASDSVLGAVASGVDLEARIADIYQQCRSAEEIREGFDALQRELEAEITERMDSTRRTLLENFDAEVHERLKLFKDEAKRVLDERQRSLFAIARHLLRGEATFDDGHRFRYPEGPEGRWYNANWQDAQARDETFLRTEEGLGAALIDRASATALPVRVVRFAWSVAASALEPWRGRAGWLDLSLFRVVGVDRQEEVLLVSALADDGATLPAQLAEKFLLLPGEVRDEAPPAAPAKALDAVRDELRRFHRQRLADRDLEFINEEEEKLTRRRDDLEALRDREIRDLTKQVTELRKQSKAAKSLDEKKKKLAEIRDVENARSERQKRFHDELLQAELEREQLMARVEASLEVTPEVLPVFTLRWELV